MIPIATGKKRVVALVPCKNGAATIAETVASLQSESAIDEVVVIDDGSADETTAVAKAAGATVLRLPQNMGKGAALTAGLAATPYASAYLLVDADTRFTAGEAVHLLPGVLRGETDLVIGVLPSAGGRGGFGLVREVAALGIRRASGFRSTAPLSGQRAIDATLLRRLELAPRFGVEVGMTIDAVNLGATVVERDVQMEHEHHGRTAAGFLHRAKQGWDVLRALRTRVIPPSVRLALLVIVAMFCAGLLLSAHSSDAALMAKQPKIHALSHAPIVQVIVVPGWTWSDVSRNGDSVINFSGLETILNPDKPYVVGSVATGKTKDIVRAIELGTRDNDKTGTNDVRVIVRPLGITRQETYADVRIVVGVTVAGQDPALRPIFLQGTGDTGAFVSAATKRLGIVDLTDISPTVQSMQASPVRTGTAQPLQTFANPHALADVENIAQRISFYDEHRTPFNTGFVILWIFVFSAAYFCRNRAKPSRIVTLLGTTIAAMPATVLLDQWLYADNSPSVQVWSATCVLILGIILLMSELASHSSVTALRRVLLLTITILTVDIINGGSLQLGGIFGSSPALGARYYGLGNTASELLFAATLLWVTLHVRAGAALGRVAEHSAWWRALTVATLVALVIGMPGLGSDVGGLFATTVSFTGLFYALRYKHLPLKRALQMALGGTVLIVIAAALDAQRTPDNRTHLGQLAARVAHEGPTPFLDTIGRKVHANIFAYGFPWTMLILAGGIAFTVALVRGRWSGVLQPGSPERIGAIAAMIGSTLAYGVNDSGIVTLVLVAIFLGPFLMVFQRHNRWDIPKLEVFTP